MLRRKARMLCVCNPQPSLKELCRNGRLWQGCRHSVKKRQLALTGSELIIFLTLFLILGLPPSFCSFTFSSKTAGKSNRSAERLQQILKEGANRAIGLGYLFYGAYTVAKRLTCLRRQISALLVKDQYILSTNYNGAPDGLAHCVDIGCWRQQMNVPSGERHELCRDLHAEQNAII